MCTRVCFLLGLSVLCIPNAEAAKSKLSSIWTFGGPAGFADTLISDKGVLYGAEVSGGHYGAGAVFELTPPKQAGGAWTETVLYDLNPTIDGSYVASLVLDKYGALYGSTGSGPDGSQSATTVFRLTPPAKPWGVWTHTTIIRNQPIITLVKVSAGALYGFTVDNAVVQLTPPVAPGGSWSVTPLYTFTDGSSVAALTINATGVIYGSSVKPAAGSIFQLTPPAAAGESWTESILYAFAGGSDGFYANTLVVAPGGGLYGTTNDGGSNGCGTVFELSPPSGGGAWTESVLDDYSGGSQKLLNIALLAVDTSGDLIVATASNSVNEGGTVFQLTPGSGGWSESTIQEFASVRAGALLPDSMGNLLVATVSTLYGGYKNGEVLEFTPPTTQGGEWAQATICSLGQNGEGWFPSPNLAFDNQGNVFGTTTWGGLPGCDSYGCGTVFQLTPPKAGGGSWSESVLYRFTGGSDGASPPAGVVMDSAGILYGVGQSGGNSNNGAVFQLTPPAGPGADWTETAIHSFDAAGDGVHPDSALVFDPNGALYGTTHDGGTSNLGTVFQITPPAVPGGVWAENVYSFLGGVNGSFPVNVVFRNGSLFGIASGPSGRGLTFFQLTPPMVGTTVWNETVLYSTGDNDRGQDPTGPLVFDADGSAYGVTMKGGGECHYYFRRSGCGVLFQLNPPSVAGARWSQKVLFNFSAYHGQDGDIPTGLAFYNGILYGTTIDTGWDQNGLGQVFQLIPGSWQESTVAHLAKFGFYGQGLTVGNASLYGATQGDGEYNHGEIFQVMP